MWRNVILLSAVLACGTFLCSCGKSVEPPARSALVNGSGALAAPVVPAEPDQGILQDPAQYQPAAFTPPASKTKEGVPAASKPAADASESARKFVLQALDDLQSYRFERVLEKIDPDQTKLLRDESAAIRSTQEALTAAMSVCREKLGADVADQLTGAMAKAVADSLQIKLTGPGAATAVPNPLLGLFGPEVARPAANLVLVDGQWRFALEAPLTSDDVAKITEYQRNMQSMMEAVSTALKSGQVDPQTIMAQLKQAAAAAQSAAGSQPDSGQEPKPGKGGRPAP